MRLSKWHLKAAIILAGLGCSGLVQRAMAGSQEPNTGITVHVYNYAKVSRHNLNEAEQVAAKIFRNAGLETQWVDDSEVSKVTQENPADPSLKSLTHFRLKILSHGMTDRLALHDDVMGLAPGAGADRVMVYVCYNRVEDLAGTQLKAQAMGTLSRPAGLGRLLGATIAHELGHVLNLPSHSGMGIMRGRWDSSDLRDLSYGSLLFTPAQAEVIRADFARRYGSPSVLFASAQPYKAF
jgi:hypothetical protein